MLIILCGLALVMSAGYGAIFALLGDYRDDYGISESRLGFVIGIGFVSGFLAQVVVAPLADRGRARQVVLSGAVMYAVGTMLLALAHSFWPMILGRFVMGLGVGSASPAIRRILIVADPARVGHHLGVLLSAEVGGFALGPAVAGLLAGPFGLAAPFYVLAAANCAFAALVLTLHFTETVEAPGPRFAFDLLRRRPFVAALLMACAIYVMIGVFDALWSLAMKDLAAPTWLTSLGISLFALPMVVMGPIGGRLAQRIGPFRWGALGLLFGVIALSCYGLVGSGMAMFVVSMCHSSADAFTFSSSSVASSLVVPEHRQAGAQGVVGGAQTLLAGLSSIGAGFIYDHHGRTAAYLTGSAIMAVLAIAGVIMAIPVWRLRR